MNSKNRIIVTVIHLIFKYLVSLFLIIVVIIASSWINRCKFLSQHLTFCLFFNSLWSGGLNDHGSFHYPGPLSLRLHNFLLFFRALALSWLIASVPGRRNTRFIGHQFLAPTWCHTQMLHNRKWCVFLRTIYIIFNWWGCWGRCQRVWVLRVKNDWSTWIMRLFISTAYILLFIDTLSRWFSAIGSYFILIDANL